MTLAPPGSRRAAEARGSKPANSSRATPDGCNHSQYYVRGAALVRISSIWLSGPEAVFANITMVGLAMGGPGMFGRREGDLNPRRFWNWFSAEAQGLANAIEALSRGESDAEWALIGLNERIRRFHPALEADVVRTVDGRHQMIVSGGSEETVATLLDAAPSMYGWHFVTRTSQADTRRVPFRLAPRPSLDSLETPISARHDAYAS
jgi:hypothetical protein